MAAAQVTLGLRLPGWNLTSIADRREFYNDSVNTFNIRIAQVPDMIVAGTMHLTPRQLFKADEADKADVKMDFSTASGKA